MKEIIYISFWFNSHWCAGVVQIKNDSLTYWRGDRYVKESIVKLDKIKRELIVKTKSGIVLINDHSVKYFDKNRLVRFARKSHLL
jgi:hypothetical protein